MWMSHTKFKQLLCDQHWTNRLSSLHLYVHTLLNGVFCGCFSPVLPGISCQITVFCMCCVLLCAGCFPLNHMNFYNLQSASILQHIHLPAGLFPVYTEELKVLVTPPRKTSLLVLHFTKSFVFLMALALLCLTLSLSLSFAHCDTPSCSGYDSLQERY